MKVAYIQLPDGNKLISYHRYDCKSVEIEGKYYMIDGGQDDIIRCSGDLKFAEVDDLIETIRDEFINNYDIKLKNVNISTIKKYIKYQHNHGDKLVFYTAIFEAELKYRKNNNII